MRISVFHTVLALFGPVFLIPASSLGQDRPSLERIESSICAGADARGDSYRAVFCDPRCDCFPQEYFNGLQPIVSCAETTPGLVTVASALTSPHDAQCALTCPNGGVCVSGFCPGGSACTVGQCAADHPCYSSAMCDTSQGFFCAASGYCVRSGPCNFGSACATNLVHPTVAVSFEVAPESDVTPLACNNVAHGRISSTDAAACVARVELDLGAGACVICGDGNLDPGEQCDDGNLTPGDGCSASCMSEP